MKTNAPKGYDLLIEIREGARYMIAGTYETYPAKLTGSRINLWHPEGLDRTPRYASKRSDEPGTVGYRLADLHKIGGPYCLPSHLTLADLGPATSPEIRDAAQAAIQADLDRRQRDGDRNAAKRAMHAAERALLDGALVDGVKASDLAKLADAYRAACGRVTT
jgi:hypothetical protein